MLYALGTLVAQAGERVTYLVPGGYPTIQAAVEAVPELPPGAVNDVTYVISIAPGTYRETLVIPRHRARMILRGAGSGSRSQVAIRAGVNKDPLTILGDDVTLRNLTVWQRAGAEDGQQQAVVVSGKRIFFADVDIIGNQDTLCLDDQALVYFCNSQISGTVDFIYGGGTGYFDHCTIVHRFRPAYPGSGGVALAPSTLPRKPFGFVFYRSIITREEGVPDNSADLYRMWNPVENSAGSAALIDCQLDRHLSSVAWTSFGSEVADYTNPDVPFRAYELGSRDMLGNPLDTTHRPVWVHQNFAREDFSRDKVLRGWVPPGG